MSDGNKFDVTTYTSQQQQRQPNRLSLEEMGNVLLDAMQGTLICLDNHHIIIEVSKSIKRYFGFEQAEILGLSILLLVEDSERDLFAKFLSSTSQLFDICCIRMMTAVGNEYRQVQVHRRKKFHYDNHADVHSTTPRHNESVGTILVLILDDSSYIDLSLFDIHKQEFYTKMNLVGEIIFEDHRGALITGYLPHEILSQSIFSFVYHEDRLVKLHALWKCVTTGASKLQWRFLARDGSLVFLQTEYKLIANHQNQETIVARNEVLNSIQRAQFEEAQKLCRHQCTLDIRGNSSSFKRMTSTDTDPSSIPAGECLITVPSLNMCFSTNRLQSLNIVGNIFDISRSARPLTIQDYIAILVEHDKYLDSELVNIINNLSTLSSRYKHLNNRTTNPTDSSDASMTEKSSADSMDPLSKKKNDSDSIVRGLLSSSIQYSHDTQPPGDSPSTLTQLLNENSGQHDLIRTSVPPQAKANQVPLTPEAFHQQHRDFLNKYRSAKTKLESQLQIAQTHDFPNGGDMGNIMKRNTILSKLSQLEHIKNKHLARAFEFKRQNQQMGTSSSSSSSSPLPVNNNLEQNHLFSSSPLSSLSPKSMSSMPMDNNHLTSTMQSSLYSPSNYYPHQRTSSPSGYRSFDSSNRNPSLSHESHPPLFDEFLTPPPSSSSYLPMTNTSLSIHSHMNVSFQETTTINPSNSSMMTPANSFNHHSTMYPY